MHMYLRYYHVIKRYQVYTYMIFNVKIMTSIFEIVVVDVWGGLRLLVTRVSVTKLWRGVLLFVIWSSICSSCSLSQTSRLWRVQNDVFHSLLLRSRGCHTVTFTVGHGHVVWLASRSTTLEWFIKILKFQKGTRVQQMREPLLPHVAGALNRLT